MKSRIIILLTVLSLGLVQAQAQQFTVADASPALQVLNGDADETLSITITSGGSSAVNYVVIGTTTNTVDGSGATDTVAELDVVISAATNSDSETPLTVDSACSLGADSTDGELLDGTYTAAPGKWLTIPWDTSDVNFYSAYVPARSALSSYRVTEIIGNPLGTGDATFSIYVDQSLAWQALATTNSSGNIDAALIPDVDHKVQKGEAMFLRVGRTTATTGNIGVAVSAP